MCEIGILYSPNLRQKTPITAVSSITLISHNNASSNPPATAYPLTAAISGFLVNIHEGP